MKGGKKNLMTARVSMLLKSRASLTCFRACFLPGRAKDLSAPQYFRFVRFYVYDDCCIFTAQPECLGLVQVSCLFLHCDFQINKRLKSRPAEPGNFNEMCSPPHTPAHRNLGPALEQFSSNFHIVIINVVFHPPTRKSSK